MKLERVLTIKIVDNFVRFGMPYCFSIQYAIKNWRRNGLGTRLSNFHAIFSKHRLGPVWNEIKCLGLDPGLGSDRMLNIAWKLLSLVPRPFPLPVFDRILYGKTVCDQKLEAGTAWERG